MIAPACPMRLPGGAVRPEGQVRFAEKIRQSQTCTCNERDNGLLCPGLDDEVSGLFFSRATDFADHDDALGLRVLDKLLQAVDEIGPIEGVAANANHRGLAQALVCGLEDGLVRQCPRAGDNPNLAFLMDVALGESKRGETIQANNVL